jgi:hypothetical protein
MGLRCSSAIRIQLYQLRSRCIQSAECFIRRSSATALLSGLQVMVHVRKLASRELTIQVHVVRVDYKMGFGELSSDLQIVSRVGHPVGNSTRVFQHVCSFLSRDLRHRTGRRALTSMLNYTHPSPSGSRSAHMDGEPPYSSFVTCLSPSLSCSAIHCTADGACHDVKKRAARLRRASNQRTWRDFSCALAVRSSDFFARSMSAVMILWTFAWSGV